MNKWLIYILILAWPIAAASQTDGGLLLEEYLELYAEYYDAEADDNETLELLGHYLENKIDLNDTHSAALADLFFVDEYHRVCIRSYIRANGTMLSTAELYLVDGLDSTTIRLMLPFVEAKAVVNRHSLSAAYMFKHARHSMTMGAKTIVEQARGYSDSVYLGAPFRLYFRYRLAYSDRMLLSISAEKDAGEQFGGPKMPYGFDHYGFSFMLKNIGRLEHIAVGSYNACFGQGLTMWSGSGMRFATDANINKHGSALRAASAMAESGSLQGVAATLRLAKRMTLTAFLSYSQRDATALATDSTGQTTFQSLYTSGYHRSDAEMEKKNRVGETVAGANLQYIGGHLSVGLTAYAQHFDAALKPAETFYNHYYFSGNDNYNVGADVRYMWNNVLLFAETAFDPSAANATIAGLQIYLNSPVRLSAYYRHYSPAYCNMYSSALGQNADSRNEQGLCTILECELPRGIMLKATADVYKFPWPKYRIYSPAIGNEYRLTLSKRLLSNAILTTQYRYRCQTANVANAAGNIAATEERQSHNLNLHLRYAPSAACTFNSRVALSHIASPSEGDTSGFLIYHEAVYNPETMPITIALRYAIFQADDYEARIYAYERDLLYEYSTPAFYKKGSRFYILLTWNVNKYTTIGMRYAIALYPGQTSIGTGYDTTMGNKRQEIKLQLSCKI